VKKDAGRQTPDVRKLILIGAFGLVMISACGPGATPTTAITTTITTSPASTTTSAPARWIWGVDEVDLVDGYSLGPCEGDANQIACIAKDGSVVGSAEYLPLPVESFDILDGVDDPVESIELIAEDYLSTFRADRGATCPNLEFRELARKVVTVGGLPGRAYGFEELDGIRTVEKNLIYGVRVEESINLYSFAAIAEGACLSNEGELTDPEILDAVRTGLDQVMAVVESG
jgi:hypothetical protein